MISVLHGGKVERLTKINEGQFEISRSSLKLLNNVTEDHNFRFSHQDIISSIPNGFECTYNQCGFIEAIENLETMRFGVQFHPEDSGDGGDIVIDNFIKMALNHFTRIGSIYVTTKQWYNIAATIGKMDRNRVANMFNITPDDVTIVWNEFRNMYKIPAMMF